MLTDLAEVRQIDAGQLRTAPAWGGRSACDDIRPARDPGRNRLSGRSDRRKGSGTPTTSRLPQAMSPNRAGQCAAGSRTT